MFINLGNVTINIDDISSTIPNLTLGRFTYIISMRNGDKHVIPHTDYLQKVKPHLITKSRNVCL